MTREETIIDTLTEALEELREIRDDISNGRVEVQNDADKAGHDAAMMVQYAENVLSDAFGVAA